MAMQKIVAQNGMLGVGWLTWFVCAFAIAWCSALYFMRQPQSPWAFDLPEAQLPSKPSNPLQLMYPATVVNCGAAQYSWCANYCDGSKIRYVECLDP